MSDKKSLILTYIFSLIGGLYGLHHLYLGRTQHALLWSTTLGGCGIGFLYEFLFLIKNYVDEANEDHSIINEYKLKTMRRKSPAFEIFRLCGQYLTAIYYGFITYYAFPDTWHKKTILSVVIGCCSAIAIALGTQITGTLGPRRCSFIWPLLGAFLGMPFLVWRMDLSPSFNLSAILSSLAFEWKIEWNPTYFSNLSATESSLPLKRKRHRFIKRCFIFGLGVMIFSAVFISAIYQNLRVNIIHQHGGFFGIDKQAYEALNLRSDASQSQIESQCRTLPRKWHPDRYRNLKEKQKAEAKFLNIQQACDRLSNERKRRQILNTLKRENPN